MERDFTLGGRDFKLCKIDAFKQLHIVRRLAPVLNDLLPAMKSLTALKNLGELQEQEKLDSVGKFLSPVLMGMSKLTDEDTEIVFLGLLQAVEMKQSAGNWARVANGKLLMIQDMELPMLVNLAGRAFMYNISSFFSALPQ